MKELRYRTKIEFEKRKLLSIIFYSFSCGFIGGVALGAWVFSNFYLALFFILLSLVLLIVAVLEHSKQRIILCTALMCAALGLGVLRVASMPLDPLSPEVESYLGQEVMLRGHVIDEPIIKEGKQHIVIEISTVQEQAVSAARVRATLERYPEIHFGDTVALEGDLARPENFETQTGRVFKYTGYLAKDGIGYVMYYPQVTAVSKASVSIRGVLVSFKEFFLEKIKRMVPEPHAALVGGVTVGAEEALGEKLEEKLRATGLIHIVVLSGYNIAIVANIIFAALGFLAPLASLVAAIGGIIGFALLTGASATIIRAAIMAILVAVSRFRGRSADVTRLLVVTAVVMLIHNPLILRYDPSFQLSFLATIGLIYVSPLFERLFTDHIPSRTIREIVVGTLATYVFVLPLLLYMTGEMSIVSLPANLLVLPVVPVLMAMGFLVFIMAMVLPRIAIIFSLTAVLLSAYIFKVVDIFSGFSFATLSIGLVPSWAIVVVYIMYSIALYFLVRYERTKLHK